MTCAGCLYAAACGDPSDATVPLPIYGGLEGGEAPRVRAAVRLEIGPLDPAAACAPFMAFLPSTSAQTLSTGVGERLTSGAGATLECRVRAEVGDSQSFGLELYLEHSALPRMRVAGPLRHRTGEGISVDVSLVGGGSLQAQCSGVARAVHPGAAWLELRDCADVVWDGVPTACTLSAGMLFEHCAH